MTEKRVSTHLSTAHACVRARATRRHRLIVVKKLAGCDDFRQGGDTHMSIPSHCRVDHAQRAGVAYQRAIPRVRRVEVLDAWWVCGSVEIVKVAALEPQEGTSRELQGAAGGGGGVESPVATVDTDAGACLDRQWRQAFECHWPAGRRAAVGRTLQATVGLALANADMQRLRSQLTCVPSLCCAVAASGRSALDVTGSAWCDGAGRPNAAHARGDAVTGLRNAMHTRIRNALASSRLNGTDSIATAHKQTAIRSQHSHCDASGTRRQALQCAWRA